MASTSPVNDQPINFLRTPSSTSIVDNKPKFYAKRMTPEEMAEQSRIATAEGLREVAAALAARGPPPHRESDAKPTSESEDSEYSSPPRIKRRRQNITNSHGQSNNRDEMESHLLKVQLASEMVEKGDLTKTVDDLKSQLQHYKSIENELVLMKSAIERLNKDTAEQTISQLIKRQNLIREEFTEHKALATISTSKVPYPELRLCFQRIIAAETRRNDLQDKLLTTTIWYRQCTETTSKVFITSVLAATIAFLIYWYFSGN
jgi:hypothetical protein